MPTQDAKQPAFTYPAPPEDMLSPVWTLRSIPVLVLIAGVLAETVFRNNFWHGAMLGFAGGLLVTLITLTFQIASITMRKDQTRSDVQDLRITS